MDVSNHFYKIENDNANNLNFVIFDCFCVQLELSYSLLTCNVSNQAHSNSLSMNKSVIV